MEKAEQGRVFIGLGGNLPHPEFGPPRQTLEAALAELGRRGVAVRRVSPWYETAPVPVSDQPWYVNAVAELKTDRAPAALLDLMHAVERSLGRTRESGVLNAARTIDLDLIEQIDSTVIMKKD